jgi:hemolysin activation/secretion protein
MSLVKSGDDKGSGLQRRGRNGVLPVLLLAAGMLLPTPSLLAQARSLTDDLIPRFDSLTPYEFEREDETEAVLPEPEPEERKDPERDDELLESLKGLYFASSADDILKEGRAEVEGVVVDGLEQLESDAYRNLVSPRIGKPVTLAVLQELVTDIVKHYRELDQPVVDVLIPEQDITSGVVQILIIEGRLASVRAEENRWFDSDLLTRHVRARRAQRILAEPLVEDVTYLNKSPYRNVDIVFTPGDEEGTTDIVLKTQDRFPVRFFAGFEDTGNDLTGEERVLTGFNWGNAFWQDHTLSYQFYSSTDYETLLAHSLFYSVPVTRSHELVSYFIYSNADAQTTDSGGIEPFWITGQTIQTGVSYEVDLPTPSDQFTHSVRGGFEFRQILSETVLNSILIRDEETEILKWLLSYECGLRDPLGQTRFQVIGYHSPGEWTGRNSDVPFGDVRANADAGYSFATFRLERVTRLPAEFEWHARMEGQIADSNLLPAEQLSLGGNRSVRGYTEDEVRGDNGYFFNLELRTPQLEISRLFGCTDPQDKLQLLGFWDYGVAANRSILLNENPDTELSSVGVGMRFFYDRFISVRADYGWTLLDTGFNQRFDSRLHMGVVLAY